ncbi:hypothetical protein HDU67_002708 [Dinochytrium kinnereticum]|nr:hypothetical protein HDU67_002708 [Dinochytrium kinnereticum]
MKLAWRDRAAAHPDCIQSRERQKDGAACRPHYFPASVSTANPVSFSLSCHHQPSSPSYPYLRTSLSFTRILQAVILLLPVAALCAELSQPSRAMISRQHGLPDDTNLQQSSILKAASPSLPTIMFEHAHTIFYTYMYVGTPPQKLKILLDTGSFSSWVRGSQCNSVSCLLAPVFFSERSQTFSSDSVKAPTIVYEDTVSSYTFTLASTIEGVNGADIDGIIGMSLHPTRVDNSTFSMFFQGLLAEGKLDKPYFSVTVNPEYDSGEVIIGGYDPITFAEPNSPIQWVPVADSTYTLPRSTDRTFQSQGSWALPLASITTSSSDLPSESFAINRAVAIVDTGSNLASIPASLFTRLGVALNGTADGEGGFWVPCDRKWADGGPTIAFNFVNGVTVEVTPAEYIRLLPIFDSSLTENSGFVDRCFLNFRPVEVEEKGYVILGNSVTKRFVTIFDYANRQVGFALAKGRTTASLAPSPTASPDLAALSEEQSPASTANSNVTVAAVKPPNSATYRRDLKWGSIVFSGFLLGFIML